MPQNKVSFLSATPWWQETQIAGLTWLTLLKLKVPIKG